jgi:hypothetical protein
MKSKRKKTIGLHTDNHVIIFSSGDEDSAAQHLYFSFGSNQTCTSTLQKTTHHEYLFSNADS